jgi:hypothetical protein
LGVSAELAYLVRREHHAVQQTVTDISIDLVCGQGPPCERIRAGQPRLRRQQQLANRVPAGQPEQDRGELLGDRVASLRRAVYAGLMKRYRDAGAA